MNQFHYSFLNSFKSSASMNLNKLQIMRVKIEIANPIMHEPTL